VNVLVKICGVTTPEALLACREGGARMVGFVFYPKSPRFLSSPDRAAALARQAAGLQRVGLFVNPQEGELERVLNAVPLEFLQLHGQESPARCMELKKRFNLKIIKAFAVAGEEDFAALPSYADTVDMFLFDAKPPEGGRPGGNARRFDWQILRSRTFPRPWLLAGGLTAENLSAAVAQCGADWVDVSSGVEDRPGHKSQALIRHFLAIAAGVQPPPA